MLRVVNQGNLMKKLNTKGFGVVEALLIVVIVGIIGGVGYFVYNSQMKTEATLDRAAKLQNDPQKTEKKQEDKYLEITEEGIKIKLSEPILDAYVISNESGQVAFGIASLDNIPACKPHEVETGPGPYLVGVVNLSFDKYDAESIKNGRSPDASAFKDNPNAVRVGNNWYEIEKESNGDCRSTDAAIQAKINAAKDAFAAASKTISPIE